MSVASAGVELGEPVSAGDATGVLLSWAQRVPPVELALTPGQNPPVVGRLAGFPGGPEAGVELVTFSGHVGQAGPPGVGGGVRGGAAGSQGVVLAEGVQLG